MLPKRSIKRNEANAWAGVAEADKDGLLIPCVSNVSVTRAIMGAESMACAMPSKAQQRAAPKTPPTNGKAAQAAADKPQPAMIQGHR